MVGTSQAGFVWGPADFSGGGMYAVFFRDLDSGT
jgi:hypothetical protein